MKVREITKQVRLRKWADDVSDRLRSGMRVREWCDEKQISYKTYYYRLQRVREAALADASARQISKAEHNLSSEISKAVSFAEISYERCESSAAPAIVLRFGGGILEINNIVEQDTIEKTLSALRSIC